MELRFAHSLNNNDKRFIMKKYIPLFLLILSLFWSCEKDPLDYEKNKVVNGAIVGEYLVTEDCGGPFGPYHVYISNSPNDADSVIIQNIFDVSGTFTSQTRIKAKVVGNHFSAEKAFSKNSSNTFKFISVDGTVEGDQISYSFEVFDINKNSVSGACTASGSRKTGFE